MISLAIFCFQGTRVISAVAAWRCNWHLLTFHHISVMPCNCSFEIWHASIGNFDGISVHYFPKLMLFWKTFLYYLQKFSTNICLLYPFNLGHLYCKLNIDHKFIGCDCLFLSGEDYFRIARVTMNWSNSPSCWILASFAWRLVMVGCNQTSYQYQYLLLNNLNATNLK